MKRVLILVILFFSISGQAQLLEVGTKFYYNQIDFGLPGYRYVLLEVIEDTLISGEECFIFSGWCACSPYYDAIVCRDEERYSIYDTETEEFLLLYDFSTEAGESWTLGVKAADDYPYGTVHVDSTNEISLFGHDLKVQHVTLDSYETGLEIGSPLIEGIGSVTSCFFPQDAVCDPLTGVLRCIEYQGQVYNFNPAVACDSIYIYSALENHFTRAVTVYPNPARDHINISSEWNTTSYVVLHDATGKVVLNDILPQMETETVNIASLEPGIYFLEVRSKNGGYTTKVIKQ